MASATPFMVSGQELAVASQEGDRGGEPVHGRGADHPPGHPARAQAADGRRRRPLVRASTTSRLRWPRVAARAAGWLHWHTPLAWGAIVIPEPDSKLTDDRVLPLTRGVAYAIVPFLVVAFAVLYPWPSDTDRLFAWPIRPMITAMVLGSAYLGGAWFLPAQPGPTPGTP